MPSMTSWYWRAQISFDFSLGWQPTIGNLGRVFTHLTPELYAMIVYKWALWSLWHHQAQVDDIEIVVVSDLILALCDLVCKFFLNPDASYEALGGVLPQNPLWGSQSGLVECLQRFLSQTLHNIEKCYTVSDHNLFTIHNDLSQCENSLSHWYTSIYTDHTSLQQILSQ
jgi:hypothetical protein